MANNSNNAQVLQGNNAQYQTAGDANSPQTTENAAAARVAADASTRDDGQLDSTHEAPDQ